jgi:internalin A
LPRSFDALSELSELELGDNKLSAIPPVLFSLPRLTKLGCGGNRNLGVPTDILESHDAGIILGYARVLTKGTGKLPLNEAKMILVGRGAVGKTTLVHQIVHGRFVTKHKTKGIKVSDWKVLGQKGDVTTHVWDFGGQEIMHGTHQFFLTERSLYLLVLAGREDREDEDAEYWLKTIRAFGGNSPVIVVLNKIKEHRFDLNEEGLREKYPNIRAFIETDCKKNFGIRKLREQVIAEINAMESVRASFPAAWFAVKQRLTDMPENFMGFDEFRAICARYGEKDPQDQEELAKFLHILGIALNYRDDPRLSETSVLNPHWVTTGIYRLLNDDAIRRRRGLLKPADVARILPARDYPKEMHDFLLRLMKKFELCFPLDDEGREYLIPELLGKKQPALGSEFDIESSLCFEYHYGSLLPEGLLPRFVVRAYTRIVDDLRWRSGVVLEWKGARALVKADEAERQVLIRVTTKDREKMRVPIGGLADWQIRERELIALIRQHFDAIHRNFKKLEPAEMIRVPKEPGLILPLIELEASSHRRDDTVVRYLGGTRFEVRARHTLSAFEVPGASQNARYRGTQFQLSLDVADRIIAEEER